MTDFTSLSFKLDIADADKKIEGLMKNMKSLENKASSAASNISTLFSAIKATDFTFSAAKDLEATNQLIREMAVAMEKAKTVTSEVSDALKKGTDVDGYKKQRTAIEGVVKTLLNVQQTIDDIRSKSSNNPNALINFLDTSEMQSQMGSIKVMYKQIKDAEDAIASSRKKTTELSVDVTDIQKADVPSMFGEKDLQKVVPGSQGIIQLSESMATMNTQIKVANEIMPVFVGHINGINDQNISFANITALVGSFERFNEIGKSEGVAKFLDATRALSQLQVGSPMSANDSQKAEDTARAYATISGMLEKIGIELNRPENHIKAQVKFDTGAEAVSRLTENIKSIIPSIESSLVESKAIIKVPISIDEKAIDTKAVEDKVSALSKTVNGLFSLIGTVKPMNVDVRNSPELEQANAAIVKIRESMEIAKQTANEVASAIGSGMNSKGFESQGAKINASIETLSKLKVEIDKIKESGRATPDALINLIDVSGLQAQIASLQGFTRGMNEAHAAMTKAGKKTTKFTVDVESIKNAELPSLLGVNDIKSDPKNIMGLTRLSDTFSSLSAPVKVLNEVLPSFIKNLNEIRDGNITFENLNGLTQTLQKLSTVGSGDAVAINVKLADKQIAIDTLVKEIAAIIPDIEAAMKNKGIAVNVHTGINANTIDTKAVEDKVSALSKTVNGLFSLIGTVKPMNVDVRNSPELEQANAAIVKIRESMESTKNVALAASEALKKGVSADGFAKQKEAIEAVGKSLLSAKNQIEQLKSTSNDNPNSLVHLVDTNELQGQITAVRAIYEQIKNAEMALSSSQKKTSKLSLDVSQIQNANLPSLFNDQEIQKTSDGGQGIQKITESIAGLNAPVQMLNEKLPSMLDYLKGISDQSISFANLNGLAETFNKFSDIGNSDGVAKFLDATRALSQIQVGSPMSANDSQKAEDTARAYATISGMMERIGIELNKPENHIKAQVKFDTGAEAVARLTENIKSIIPSIESSLVESKAIIKVPIDIDSANLKIDKSTEKINSIQDGIRKVVESSNSIKDRQVTMPPFIPTPPTKVSIEKIITDVRAFLRTMTIRLPSFIATRPSKESLDKVISEIRQLINERALRITNIALIKPSSDKVSAFVKDVQGMINTHNPTMNVVGIANADVMRQEIIGITEDLKKLSNAAKIPGVPEDVLKSLESYGKELRSIAKAMDTIHKMRGAVNVANAETAKTSQTATKSERKNVDEEIRAIKDREEAKINEQKNAAAEYAKKARQQVAEMDEVKRLGLQDKALTDEISKDRAKTTNEIKKFNERADNSANSVNAYAKSMEEFKNRIASVKAPVQDTSAAIQQIKLNPNNAIDPLKELRAELKLTDSSALNLARSMGMYVGGRSIINFFREATRKANSFGIELRKIQSLASNFSFDTLSKGLMELDSRLGNVIHNATTLYWAFSSGVRGTEKELVDFTETMAKTAITISADVIPTMDAATSLMNAYGLKARDAKEVGDLMFQIVKEGKAHGSELAASFGHVVATSASMGVTLDELGAAVATLTRSIRTSRSLTYLNNILGKMINPADNVRKAAEKMGVDFSITAVKAKGFTQVMRELQAATGGNAEAIAQLFPDLRGQRAAITLLSTQFGDFEDQLEKFKNKRGSMETAFGAISDTPEAQLRSLKNTINMIAIEAGRTANSFMTLGGALEPVLAAFNDMSADGKELAGRMAASGAAMIGMIVAQKAYAAAQYANAQASIQNNMLDVESAKIKVVAAESARKQALELKQLELAQMQVNLANDEANNKELKAAKDTMDAIKLQEQEIKNLQLKFKIQTDLNNLSKDAFFGAKTTEVARQEYLISGLRSAISNIKFNDENVSAKINSDTFALISKQLTMIDSEIRQAEAETRMKISDASMKKMQEAARLRLDADYLSLEDSKANAEEIAERTMLAKKIMHEVAVQEKAIGNAAKEEILKKRLAKATGDLALRRAQEADLASTRATAGKALERVLTAEAARYGANVQVTKDAIKYKMASIGVADSERIMTEKINLEKQALNVQEQKTNAALQIQNIENDKGIASQRAKIEVTKAYVNEMMRANAAEQTNTANMIANAEAAVRLESARGNRRGAVEASKRVAELNSRAAYLQIEGEKLAAKQRDAMQKAELVSKNDIANATKLVNDEKRKELHLTKQIADAQKTQMSIFDVGRRVSGKGGKGGGLGWSDVGMYGGMIAGRGLAAAFGPGAAMMSMLPMQKMWNTSKQSIGVLTAAIMKAGVASKVLTVTGLIPFSTATNKLTSHMLQAKLSTLFALKWEQKLNAYRMAAATTAGAAALGIGALAVAIGMLLSKTKKGGPMSGVAEWMLDIKGMEKEQEAHDHMKAAYDERVEKSADIIQQSKQILWQSKSEVKYAQERLESLKKSGATAEQINQAQKRLLVATSKYEQETSRQRDTEKFVKDARREQSNIDLAQRALERAQLALQEANRVGDSARVAASAPLFTGEVIDERDKRIAQANADVKAAMDNLDAAKKAAVAVEEVRKISIENAKKSMENSIKFDKETIFINTRTADQQKAIYAKRMQVSMDLMKNAKENFDLEKLMNDEYNYASKLADIESQLKGELHADRTEELKKDKEKYEQLYQNAKKIRDEAPKKIIDTYKNFFNSVNDYLNSLPKAVQEGIDKRNEMADYWAIFRGDGGRLDAAKRAVEETRKYEKETRNKLSEFINDFGDELGSVMHNEALKTATTDRMNAEKEFNSQLQRLAEMVNRTNESIAQKMKDITNKRFERAIENPSMMYSQDEIRKMATTGRNPIAIITDEWNRVIMEDARVYQKQYESFMAKNAKAFNDTEIATNTQAAYDALMKWDTSVVQTIDNIKKLAEAEKSANTEAYNLAMQLNNAFKVTAQAGVQTQSVEAVRLMSRSFSMPVQAIQENTMQERLIQRMQNHEATLAAKLGDMQKSLSDVQIKYTDAGNTFLKGSDAIAKAGDSFRVGADTFKNSLDNMPKFRIVVENPY